MSVFNSPFGGSGSVKITQDIGAYHKILFTDLNGKIKYNSGFEYISENNSSGYVKNKSGPYFGVNQWLIDEWNSTAAYNTILGEITATAFNAGSAFIRMKNGGNDNIVISLNKIEKKNGTNPQIFELYNTFTNNSNYERAFSRWSGNVLNYGMEKAGTGLDREIRFNVNAANHKYSFYRQSDRHLDIYYTSSQHFMIENPVTAIYINGAQGVTFGSSSDLAWTFNNSSVTIGRDATPVITMNPRISDIAAKPFSLTGGPAFPTAVTNLVGGSVTFKAGNGASSSLGNAHGGNLILGGGIGYGTGHNGYVVLADIPTSNPMVAGAIWNLAGVLQLSSG
jgi:hypothetical protein